MKVTVKDLKESPSDYPDSMEVVIITSYSSPSYSCCSSETRGNFTLQTRTVSVHEESEVKFGRDPDYFYDNGFYQKPNKDSQSGVNLHPYPFPGEGLPKREVLTIDQCISVY